ncbi:hypothetical protein PIB30_035826 [Stylosanthes scabra]|uniref:Uncharacterized protein n=1 Tax=Stylosanthes scabra TaxID=79078 RepID=A0ABU6YBZ5_9FABA|nr:hypothetical protein [Stylosanthes scabra]
MERKTASSGVQPRNDSNNTLSTNGGPKQAAQKVRQFRPPRSEARPAKSAWVVVPQIPAARDYSRSRADLEDTDSDDEDYNPEADVDKSLEDHLDELTEREDVERRGKETLGKNRGKWEVHIIENGVERPENITANEVFSLLAGRQVVLHFDNKSQPVGQSGGLLIRVLGSMANDFSLFPIGVRSWKQMTVYKEREFNRQIKATRVAWATDSGVFWELPRQLNTNFAILNSASILNRASNTTRFFYFEDDKDHNKKKAILTRLGKILERYKGELVQQVLR